MPFLDVTVVIANELLLPKDPGRIKNTIYTPSLKLVYLEGKFPSGNETESVILALTACLPTVCLVLYMHLARQNGIFWSVQFSSLSGVRLFGTPWTVAHQASLSITNSQSLLKLMFIMLVMPYNHLILCHPLLLLPAIFHSIRVFSNESVHHIRWPKYWSFSIGPSNEYSGLIFFRMD